MDLLVAVGHDWTAFALAIVLDVLPQIVVCAQELYHQEHNKIKVIVHKQTQKSK